MSDRTAEAQAIIDTHPKACYRTLEVKLSRAGLLDDYEHVLSAARPLCGYGCDGEDGPNPNGTRGCPVSGRCEQ